MGYQPPFVRYRDNRQRFGQLDTFNDEQLRARYRFGRLAIEHIVRLVEGDLKHETLRNHSIDLTTQVLVALQFYASGAGFIDVVLFYR